MQQITLGKTTTFPTKAALRGRKPVLLADVSIETIEPDCVLELLLSVQTVSFRNGKDRISRYHIGCHEGYFALSLLEGEMSVESDSNAPTKIKKTVELAKTTTKEIKPSVSAAVEDGASVSFDIGRYTSEAGKKTTKEIESESDRCHIAVLERVKAGSAKLIIRPSTTAMENEIFECTHPVNAQCRWKSEKRHAQIAIWCEEYVFAKRHVALRGGDELLTRFFHAVKFRKHFDKHFSETFSVEKRAA